MQNAYAQTGCAPPNNTNAGVARRTVEVVRDFFSPAPRRFGEEEIAMNSSAQLQELSQQLSHQLDAQGMKLKGPAKMKELRKFSIREAARFLEINYHTLRHYLQTMMDRLPTGERDGSGKRLFSAEEMYQIKKVLFEEGKISALIHPQKQGEEPCVVISCLGQKEETSVSAHIAANLALCGYRVLCCDLDSRAILTKVFGSRQDLNPGVPSVYEMIRPEKPLAAQDVIQKTYFPNIDLIPASLNLLEFELALSFWDAMPTNASHTQVAQALERVLPDYDVVILNTPHQLSFGMLAGLLASQGVVIPINLSRQEITSLANTLRVADKLMGLVEAKTPDRGFDFVKFLITRSEVMSRTEIQAASFLRSTLDKFVMQAELCKSDLMAKVTASNQTVFEIEPQSVTRKSYDKVTEPIWRITGELKENISKARRRIA